MDAALEPRSTMASGEFSDPLLRVLAEGIEVFDLGHPMFAGMPQSSLHPRFSLTLQRRHGDLVRPDGGSGANEVIVTGGHVGTHIDALAHISHAGRLHGGISASWAQAEGRFRSHGIEELAPIVTRGLLLDVPAALDIECCAPAYEITASDLERALRLTGTGARPGDVLLVRTGWGRHFADPVVFSGEACGAPGPGEEGARLLADLQPRAVGSDTIAFERIPGGAAVDVLPAHRLLLVERGIHIMETMNLDDLAEASVREFVFVLCPLKLVGATGSPARPIAVRSCVPRSEASQEPARPSVLGGT